MHHAWRWTEITRTSPEAFTLLQQDERVAGIWCSTKRAPIALREGSFYRLDYLEVAPELRGAEMGVFLLMVVAARARELGATGIVLGTWPPLRPFYRRIGAMERLPVGWNLPPNLVPFVLEADLLESYSVALRELEHGQDTDIR